MSDAITPISDALASQERLLAAEEQKRELLVRQAAADQVERVRNDQTALADRLAKLRGQDQILSDVKDALNITAATQAAVGNSAEILARLKELTLRSASETLSSAQREVLQVELDSLTLQLRQIATAPGEQAISTQKTTALESNRTASANATAADASTAAATADLDVGNNGVPGTEAAMEVSTSSHNLIVGHTDASVLAQANQIPGIALKLLEET